jgi:phosphatidylglycerophosphatase A
VFDPDGKPVEFDHQGLRPLWLKRQRPAQPQVFTGHPAHFIACGCGSGLTRWAPGTFGTIFAWITFALFRPHFSDFNC